MTNIWTLGRTKNRSSQRIPGPSRRYGIAQRRLVTRLLLCASQDERSAAARHVCELLVDRRFGRVLPHRLRMRLRDDVGRREQERVGGRFRVELLDRLGDALDRRDVVDEVGKPGGTL